METTPELAIDPVCGEEIDTSESDYASKYQGTTYYFCSLNCQLDFEENPERYLGLNA
ncbi:MAG TPA: YHS domain-containing protein [Armatimonadota bacterium]|nr:YHS domain-containing protein [Armatimonadota bacterium]